MVHPALSQQKSSLPRKPAPFPGRRQVVLTTVPPPLFPTGTHLSKIAASPIHLVKYFPAVSGKKSLFAPDQISRENHSQL